MAEAAHWMAAGHILRVTERRPLVQLKLALAADGSVPRGSRGKPAWATSAPARAQGHLMRARADAILVGRGTVIDDDPLLTCRLPGLEDRSPVRVVLARRLAGLAKSRLVATARASTPCGSSAGRVWTLRPLEAAGVRVFRAPEVGGELWLPSVMETLVAQGITRLLVEGGPITWRAFSHAGLVDEAVLFHARAEARQAIAGPAAAGSTQSLRRGGKLAAFRSSIGRQRRYDGVSSALAQLGAARDTLNATYRGSEEGQQRCSPASSPTSARSPCARTAASPSARAIRRPAWRSARRWRATAAA